MTKNHEYDRDTALEHAVTLAAKGRISPEDVTTYAKEYLGFLDPSTFAPPAFGARVKDVPAPVTVFWDEDENQPYYRFFKDGVGYLHTTCFGLREDASFYSEEGVIGFGYVVAPEGHRLPREIKEAIA